MKQGTDLVALSILFSILFSAGLSFAEGQDAGQPGDVVDVPPVVDPTTPQPVDAGPVGVDAGPREQQAPAPRTDGDASGAAPVLGPPATGDLDAERAQPETADATPQLAEPVVRDVEPRIDPDGERTEPPALPEPEEPPLPNGIGFGGVPAINFDADNGFGFGLVATIFDYDGKTKPYRTAATLTIFMTSKLVQDHSLAVDMLNVADLPLRLTTRVGYLQSLTQNYCGLGGDVTCDPAVAEAAAGDLEGEARDVFIRRFYQRRFINPNGSIMARWALTDTPARFEIMGGYRGYYFIPGTWDDEDQDGKSDLFPYPGSLYAQDFPDGEPGYDSIVQLGFMLDTRDNEPAPTEGVWFEASVRASSPLIGSSFEWSGANLTIRGYTPLTQDRKIVLANRFVFDGVVGDPPIQDLARAGGVGQGVGTTPDYYIYGGSEAGRGIRVQRYLGKLRVFDQTELRWTFAEAEFLEQRFGFTAAAFLDAGIVGKELAEPGAMPLLTGFGGAMRISWNENFIVRIDMGFSPIESYAPSLYILIGNPF